jgi:hypothetical protein
MISKTVPPQMTGKAARATGSSGNLTSGERQTQTDHDAEPTNTAAMPTANEL